MEQRLKSGFKLYIEEQEGKLIGIFIRKKKDSYTQINTQPEELDFFRILPNIVKQLEQKSILALNYKNGEFFGYIGKLTENAPEIEFQKTSNFFPNILVDLEEAVSTRKQEEKTIKIKENKNE